MTSKEHIMKEAAENKKKGLGTIIGKISGKEQFELEIERLNSRIDKLESDLQSTKVQLEKKESLARQAVTDRQEAEARLNQELVRTQTLSHELEIVRAESPEKFEFRRTENLSPSAVQAYISNSVPFMRRQMTC